MSELEYGPGIAVPYFKDQEDTLEADIEVIKTAISGMKWKGKDNAGNGTCVCCIMWILSYLCSRV